MHPSHEKKHRPDEILQGVIKIICYISLPLILLFWGTIVSSLLISGSINTNVNTATSFVQVAVSFSLPMLITLTIIPLTIQFFLQHNTFENLGFSRTPQKWSLIVCAFLGVFIVAVTYTLSGNKEIEISAGTICFHFLIVAISEEVILRSVIMYEMRTLVSNPFILCIMNAVIFAFVYHSSEDFLSNLLIRVPLGLVLSYSRLKSNDIYLPIMLHWAYNMGLTAIG